MSIHSDAPWHYRAWQRFCDELLPGLLGERLPLHDALWGLARLSRSDAGHREIEALLGAEVKRDKTTGIISKGSLHDGLMALIEREGMAQGLEVFDQLFRRGFAVARQAGGSMHPFIGFGAQTPAAARGRTTRSCGISIAASSMRRWSAKWTSTTATLVRCG